MAKLPAWQIGLLCALIVVLEGVGAAIGTSFKIGNAALPPSAPPGIVFAVVWPILYLLAAGGLWFQCVAKSTPSGMQWAGVAVMAAQLVLSFAWSPVFVSGNTQAATWIAVSMLALVAPGLVLAARTSTVSAALWAPYAAWLVFALVLCSEVNQRRATTPFT